MKALLGAIPVCALVLFPALNGCTRNDADMPDTNPEPTGTLYEQIGGADSVTRLADQFGSKIANNPTLNPKLDTMAINEIETGFTNDVIKASGMTPNGITTLSSALAGKGLDETDVSALSSALREAGASLGMDAGLMANLSATIVEPAARSAMGM